MTTEWKRILTCCVASTLVMVSAVVAVDYASQIEAASSRLLSSSSTPEGARSDFLALVNVLDRMAQDQNDLPVSARAKIREAAEALRSNPSLEGNGVQALNQAWPALSNGQSFAFPAEVKDLPGAAKRIRARIHDCTAAIRHGDSSRAVRDLLYALLMIAAPMEAQ